jgi:CO dehydrogenase maturation factor
MRIAVAGKRGVGKTTLAAALACVYARQARTVVAVDAADRSCLGRILGVPADLLARQQPINLLSHIPDQQNRPGSDDPISASPDVDALPEPFCIAYSGVHLLRWEPGPSEQTNVVAPAGLPGEAMKQAIRVCGSGVVILDLSPSIEQAADAICSGIDCMLVLVEPGWRSLEVAHRLARLTANLSFHHVFVAGNKVHTEQDREFIAQWGCALPVIGCLSFDPEIARLKSLANDHDPVQLFIETEAIVSVLEKIRTEQ